MKIGAKDGSRALEVEQENIQPDSQKKQGGADNFEQISSQAEALAEKSINVSTPPEKTSGTNLSKVSPEDQARAQYLSLRAFRGSPSTNQRSFVEVKRIVVEEIDSTDKPLPVSGYKGLNLKIDLSSHKIKNNFSNPASVISQSQKQARENPTNEAYYNTSMVYDFEPHKLYQIYAAPFSGIRKFDSLMNLPENYSDVLHEPKGHSAEPAVTIDEVKTEMRI